MNFFIQLNIVHLKLPVICTREKGNSWTFEKNLMIAFAELFTKKQKGINGAFGHFFSFASTL